MPLKQFFQLYKKYIFAIGIIILIFCCIYTFSLSSDKRLKSEYNKILLDLQGSANSDKDSLTACKKMLELAEKDYTPAQRFVGKYYKNKGNFAQFEYWLTKAAEQGDTIAAVHLGVCYSYGTCVKKIIQKLFIGTLKLQSKV